MELSVVVPAHDEAAVIGRLLSELQPLAAQGALRLVVACNGCTDDTAAVARATAPSATVVEVPEASKTAALNAGDAACDGVFPRFYVDADIGVTGRDLIKLARHFDAGLLAVAPTVRYDASASSWVVRRHLRVFELSAPHAGGIHGTGVMGVSAEGRRRFASWPEVVADDYFLDGLFTDSEKTRVEAVEVTVTVSRRLGDLVRRRTRLRRGNEEVHHRGLRMTRPQSRSLVALIKERPSLLPDVSVFVLVAVLVRFRAKWTAARGDATFARDDSR